MKKFALTMAALAALVAAVSAPAEARGLRFHRGIGGGGVAAAVAVAATAAVATTAAAAAADAYGYGYGPYYYGTPVVVGAPIVVPHRYNW
jgi:hypothetical protein